jgi:hypothetical protein
MSEKKVIRKLRFVIQVYCFVACVSEAPAASIFSVEDDSSKILLNIDPYFVLETVSYSSLPQELKYLILLFGYPEECSDCDLRLELRLLMVQEVLVTCSRHKTSSVYKGYFNFKC